MIAFFKSKVELPTWMFIMFVALDLIQFFGIKSPFTW